MNYHHVIHALRRKPMALLHLVYRDQLFPREAYRRTFDALLAERNARLASRCMVGLLALAHEWGCEAALAQHLKVLLEAGELQQLDVLREGFAPAPAEFPHVEVRLESLGIYDALMDRPRGGGMA
ncbi:hypothetical protein [Halomonas montanilacus]|uniref:hypothetical protein n=1 Tax=Billgrantia montanilacus TaxID=2282305 RepID=UPI0011C04C09